MILKFGEVFILENFEFALALKLNLTSYRQLQRLLKKEIFVLNTANV